MASHVVAAECTLETLPATEKQKIEKMLDTFSKVAMAESQKACAKAPAVQPVAELPYVEIWIDKDGKTLRREGANNLSLTLVIVVDGTIVLERAFDSDSAYDTKESGNLVSYYLKSHIGGKYRVVSNVLYVKK